MTLFFGVFQQIKDFYEEFLTKSCQKNPFFGQNQEKNSKKWQNPIVTSGKFGLLNRESGILKKFTKSTDFTS